MLGDGVNSIIDAQWDSNWTYTFQGGILFAAVMLNLVVRNAARMVFSPLMSEHLLEVEGLSKYYGEHHRAERHLGARQRGRGHVRPRDNGPAKSSFIKILSGCTTNTSDVPPVPRRRR